MLSARQHNCSGSRHRPFVMGTSARLEANNSRCPNGHQRMCSAARTGRILIVGHGSIERQCSRTLLC